MPVGVLLRVRRVAQANDVDVARRVLRQRSVDVHVEIVLATRRRTVLAPLPGLALAAAAAARGGVGGVIGEVYVCLCVGVVVRARGGGGRRRRGLVPLVLGQRVSRLLPRALLALLRGPRSARLERERGREGEREREREGEN